MRISATLVVLLAAVSCACSILAQSAAGQPAPVTLTDYTHQKQMVRWGNRSHWAQPWRSYMDTVPASTLRNAAGINFNVPHRWADSTARLLAASGFKRARLEVGWGSLEYDDPTRMKEFERSTLRMRLEALQEAGIRPLIVLNANHGQPVPVKDVTITLTQPASPGDQVLHIDPADRSKIVLHHTGISSQGRAARHLFTSVTEDGVASLSRPLVATLPAGPTAALTLKYRAFAPSHHDDGTSDARFEETMAGWLNYVDVVMSEVKGVLGNDEFDVEVWNELSFGSDFLEIAAYYTIDVAVAGDMYGHNRPEILKRTIAWLRDPAHGVPDVGIGDGFANQSPWQAGSTSPVGLTAIDKHPYAGWFSFPSQARINGNRPLNSLGQLDGLWIDHAPCRCKQYAERWTPEYEAFLPEYFLHVIQTESLSRDLAPFESLIGGEPHGRYTHPPGGPPPTMWITEVNLSPTAGPEPDAQMTTDDIGHMTAKNALRYLSAYVNKGVTALHFYAARAGNLSLIEAPFFQALHQDFTKYPGDAPGGRAMAAVRRLMAAMKGPDTLTRPRALSLLELTDYAQNTQFAGNGTPEFAPLYNRDVFAFLPFQTENDKFVVPVYVMTRNVAKNYGGSGPQRFDLPQERYALKIGGVDGSDVVASATDPLTGESVPVSVVERGSDHVRVELAVTDYPRLLVLDENPGGVRDAGPAPADPPATSPPLTEPPATPRDERSSDRPSIRLKARRGLRVDVQIHCPSSCSAVATGKSSRRSVRNRARGRGRLELRLRFRVPPRAARRRAAQRVRVQVTVRDSTGTTRVVRQLRLRP